jgi:CheY-like chemotaxis protein
VRRFAAHDYGPKLSSVSAGAYAGKLSMIKIVRKPALDGAPHPHGTHRARVLVVDDSPVNRSMIRAHLTDEKFEVEEADNGAIAVAKACSASFDIILMDIQMPELDGYAAIRAIREAEQSASLRRIPIIAFTVAAFDDDIRKALDSGADLHIGKPVKKDALIGAIGSLIQS